MSASTIAENGVECRQGAPANSAQAAANHLARVKRDEKRLRDQVAWAKQIAAQIAGCSIEATLIAIRDAALFGVDWKRVAIEAQLRQIDLEEVRIRRRLKSTGDRVSATLDALEKARGTEDYLDAWDAYKRARGPQQRALDDEEALWDKREALWKQRRS